ncbi:MAG: hypothetical protein ICV66_08455, partial [Chitinophagaceae bacterium]|nr:hypothetical protein [Chitinophagaceae bacterium]
YFPFSGTVRKPIYFFFIKYFNWLWQKGKFPIKKREEAQLRLEKLLVLSWKKRTESLLGNNVLGNRQRKINPFKGNDGNWIVQTCFRIYGTSVNKVVTDESFIQKYLKDNQGEEQLLHEFLTKNGVLDNINEAFLQSTLAKLSQKKFSLFNGYHQLSDRYKRLFKRYLEDAVWNTNPEYYNDIYQFFNPTVKLEERLYKRTIENERKYPFKSLNKWFAAFILAVDKDINNENSETQWKKADELFLKIPDQYRKELAQRPDVRCWLDKVGNKYIPKHANQFDEQGWDALLRRANSSNFYDFKHNAFISLLKESY